MNPAPTRLGREDPIVEALCEMRFRSSGQGVGGFLPGILFPRLKASFPNLEKLPTIPLLPQLLTQNPSFANLAFMPQYRLVGEGHVIAIGDNSLSVAVQSPYPGWMVFRDFVRDTWGTALDSGLIDDVERFSIKYINLLSLSSDSDISSVAHVKLALGNRGGGNPQSLFIREERRSGDFINVTQLVCPATVNVPGKAALSGLVVDLDIIRSGPFPDFNGTYLDMLDKAHTEVKNKFFDLLTQEALIKYEPEYE